ncbi:uncharacterized protein YneF (UPF0154 family) [Algoriphagus sp. 4150]|uniref:DUF3592 domain-containing protein n=1 Tax=Algoriphagus sp. 4150 TaxID=2817756 RepID=UPI002863869C|nr:DUF3592 domain-containing protein [Algoriphagus sp. 4150]MDR7129537.1 uncharacterized protein YneF (UPF0154 family) [Algoriphagus sp. 4150]
MKIIKIISYIFALIGLGLLVGAFVSYQNTSQFIKEASKTEGTVIRLLTDRSGESVMYKPAVEFTDEKGNTVVFNSSTSSNPPSYTEQEKVSVLYPPDDPQKAEIEAFFPLWGGVLVLGILGSVFFLVGGGIILVKKLKGDKESLLKSRGKLIQTDFQSVVLNTSLTVNGRHPYHILSQWKNPGTSKVHVFKSNNLWFDPSDYIVDKSISVFIEPSNPKKYHVDLSFLPKLEG